MLAIHASGLAKTYSGAFGRRPQEALRGVDLDVSEGTAFGLIGPNGAGKTTFVKAILGLVRPSAGVARLLGGDPGDPRPRARVGYLPERLQFPPALDARAILRSVARLKRLRDPEAAIDRRIDELGLAEVASRRAGTYSKGMRQRLGLACALLGAPALLVLDEPTDGLDPLARVEVRNLLARELARGATLFLNSHLLSETERVCTRIGILVGGRIVREGALDAMRESTSRWAVRFDGNAQAQPLAAAGFSPAARGEGWTFDGEPPALNEALERARRSGALLVELSRESRDLEAVLQDAVGVPR
ncbi:MAG TPA: ABC transporter ATP-binding protein [Anaeromyxobacter sp.]